MILVPFWQQIQYSGEIQQGLKIKKFIDDPSLDGKQQKNEPGRPVIFKLNLDGGCNSLWKWVKWGQVDF